MMRRCVKMCNECMHGTCQVTVHLYLLLQDDGTGVSEDHSTGTSSSATVAVNQRDDTAMSSSGYGSSTDDNCSALPMPRSFTPVGGTPTGPLPTTYPLPNPLHQPFHVPLLWPHPTSQTSQQLLSCELSICIQHHSQQSM